MKIMNEKLDLKMPGVEELSKEELMKVEGGMRFWYALFGFALSLAIGLFVGNL
jgi:bacteriocin-like protein